MFSSRHLHTETQTGFLRGEPESLQSYWAQHRMEEPQGAVSEKVVLSPAWELKHSWMRWACIPAFLVADVQGSWGTGWDLGERHGPGAPTRVRGCPSELAFSEQCSMSQKIPLFVAGSIASPPCCIQMKESYS